MSPTPTKISQEARPVYCRDCYVPMESEPRKWVCPKCGRAWDKPVVKISLDKSSGQE